MMSSRMREFSVTAGLLAVIAAGLATSAAAGVHLQDAPAPTPAPPSAPPRPIAIGQPVEAAFAAGDATESRYDDYRLELNAGDSIQIDLESDAFDPYLELRRPGVDDPLDANDDRGDSLNSRLIFNAPRSGAYIIRAGRLFDGSGPYRLAVTRLTSAPAPLALAAGRTEGGLDEGAPVLPGSTARPHRYALYEFRGAPGDRIRIDMTSPVLDSRLELLDSRGTVLVRADDGGANRRDARLLAILRSDATYTVRASAPASQAGRFEIDLRQARAASAPPPVELRRGAPLSAGFDFDSAAQPLNIDSNAIRYFYRDFALPVRARETITIDLESTDFDPHLEVGVMSPIGFAIAMNNDDAGLAPNRLNSRLVLRPEADGRLQVRARTRGSITGCYVLRVTSGAPQPAPAPAPAPAQPTASRAASEPQTRNPQACAAAAVSVPAQPR